MSKCTVVEYWKYHLHKITGNSIVSNLAKMQGRQ